jgi:hypothetical protein
MCGACELDELEKLRTARPRRGLAALVGRWDDGEELADEVDRVVAGRSLTGRIPEFES